MHSKFAAGRCGIVLERPPTTKKISISEIRIQIKQTLEFLHCSEFLGSEIQGCLPCQDVERWRPPVIPWCRTTCNCLKNRIQHTYSPCPKLQLGRCSPDIGDRYTVDTPLPVVCSLFLQNLSSIHPHKAYAVYSWADDMAPAPWVTMKFRPCPDRLQRRVSCDPGPCWSGASGAQCNNEPCCTSWDSDWQHHSTL